MTNDHHHDPMNSYDNGFDVLVAQRLGCRTLGFDSRPGRNQVTAVNSAYHPSGVGKSRSSLTGWGYGGVSSLVSGGK